ncbi:cysteine proteinase [Periconia macrospinosa]|uniref:Cysteine proteinase n=1 Tax=Periconia macrospinosa TaxID=97972 RepID=A0A2V1D2Z1_9PLEO|nr:cysteine proteinase [Periconia macrospinosa]
MDPTESSSPICSSDGDTNNNNTMTPQDVVETFWSNMITKKPSKVTNIFPATLYANLLPPFPQPGKVTGQNAAESYQAAADECRARVRRIVRECQRTNQKFTDPEFDIEEDAARARAGASNCLEGIARSLVDEAEGQGEGVGDVSGIDSEDVGLALKILGKISGTTAVTIDLASTARVLGADGGSGGGGDGGSTANPLSIHRIDWIFENPSFTVDGFSSSDVRQGGNGDCWFIAAVASICSNPSLMERVCVERDEECGVYGFVFYRDGEWTWTVVDDNLYLEYPDFDVNGDYYDATGAEERKWKKTKQTGSDALYFASCADQNETWLPLLEKAYAKVHGDYEAIVGGWSGEGVEDLTGGVTTTVLTNRILSKERLWKELLRVNQEFLFTASANHSYHTSTQKGLPLNHAYSVIKAVEAEDEEGKKHRLVQIRNPWGKRSWTGSGEWNGAWGDGAKEWTPYWMNKLNYRFADDGIFWMSFDDLQKRFRVLDRTRLFDKDWTVVQQWTSVDVAWVTGYLNTKFVVEINKAGPTVFVLCQLDDRYFKGLEGKYRFDLHFVLQEDGATPGEHIVRARGAMYGNRSISAEVDLDPGKYHVVPKIAAYKDDDAIEIYDAVQTLAKNNPQKLRQIGLNYDIANAKGVTEEQKREREEKTKKKSEEERKKKEEEEKDKAEFEAWKKEKREREEKEKEKEKKKAKGAKTAKHGAAGRGRIGRLLGRKKKTDESTALSESSDSDDDEPEAEEGRGEKEKEKTDNKTAAAKTQKSTTTPPPSSSSDNTNNTLSTAAADAPDTTKKDDDDDSGAEDEDDDADNEKEKSEEDDDEDDEKKQKSWNAVCVLGLRVYSKDAAVSIKLVKARDPEEGAVLDVDGATGAGATM